MSVLEFLTLVRKGWLRIGGNPYRWLSEALTHAPLREAPVTHAIPIDSQRLDLAHWDPADRLIAGTSRILEAMLVTADQRLIESRELKVLANR